MRGDNMHYKYIQEQTKNCCLPCAGINELGENVIISAGRDESLGNFYQSTTAQENGWCRINRFYENGSTEEFYKKGYEVNRLKFPS